MSTAVCTENKQDLYVLTPPLSHIHRLLATWVYCQHSWDICPQPWCCSCIPSSSLWTGATVTRGLVNRAFTLCLRVPRYSWSITGRAFECGARGGERGCKIKTHPGLLPGLWGEIIKRRCKILSEWRWQCAFPSNDWERLLQDTISPNVGGYLAFVLNILAS